MNKYTSTKVKCSFTIDKLVEKKGITRIKFVNLNVINYIQFNDHKLSSKSFIKLECNF